MIKEVELRNIKSYKEAVVKFTPGTNSIIGENGAGKTTILESVGFVLFDYLPYTLSTFIRGGENTGMARVTVLSRIDGREYEIIRRITKTSTSEYIVVDPELKKKICEGKVDVLDWIRKNLGLGKHIELRTFFENAVGVRQGAMVSPFLLPPHARKSIFSPLLGLDVYRTAFEKSREYLNFLEKNISELKIRESELCGRLNTLKERLKMLSTLKNELNEDLKRLNVLEKKLKEVKSRKEKLEKTRERISETETELKVLTTRITEVRENIERVVEEIREIDSRKKEMEKHERAYRQYMVHEKKLTELEKNLEDLIHKREALLKDRIKAKELETRMESLKKRLEDIKTAEEEISRLERLIDEVKEAEEEEKLLIKIEKEYAVTKEKKLNISSEIERIEERIEQLKRLSETAESYKKKIESLGETELKIEKLGKIVNHLESRIKLFSENLKSLKKSECPFIQEKCDRVIEKIGDLKAQIETMIRKRERALELLENHKKEVEELRTLRTEYEKLRVQLEQLPDFENELEKLSLNLKKINEQLNTFEEKIKMRKIIEDRIRSYRELQQKLAIYRNKIQEKEKIDSDIKNMENELENLKRRISHIDGIEKEIKEIEEHRKKLQHKLEELKKGYETYLSLIEVIKREDHLKDRLERDRNLLKDFEDKLKQKNIEYKKLTSSFDQEELRKVEEMFQNLTSEAGMIKGRIAEKKRQIEELEKDAEETEELKEQLNEIEKTIEMETVKHNFLKEVREIFNEAIPAITGAYVRVISQDANRLFNEIMGDYSWTLEWKEDFGIVLKHRGRELDFGQLSGGEQMVAAISVRLALLKHLSGLDFAFFDEPTQNMDEIRRMNLANQIGRIAGFSQLFVISHDDTFEEVTDNSIRIVKEGGYSMVVQ